MLLKITFERNIIKVYQNASIMEHLFTQLINSINR